ncbi:nitroreductase family deazaflavin-dependent oxidoreductase [Streptomyces coelicoflavus]|uniref:Nitroreductase family deazaflavin-dependent oxidoreductase n=1 Tax=Streptomyces coelicoflavus TaxID=285562 RepID=A0A7K3PPT2_9ACTN|nr:nitroreductase family deazaflavin-dependent oxidoreductase [Streptomyces coelicoflavus]NEB11259.1 nitroreductase family deazaflavin-dependent oxidoreductase [Streptomyces coelicoflavus]
MTGRGTPQGYGSRAEYNIPIINEYRANSAEKGPDERGAGLLLLTTTGARSGLPRTSPLGYSTDAGRLVVVGAKGGTPSHPDWYRNLLANPEVTVEQGSETFHARATEVTGTERNRLYAQHLGLFPDYRDYEQKTDRVFPVVVLERIDG